jgi:hypothetical protein
MSLKEKYAYYLLDKKIPKNRGARMAGFSEKTVAGVLWHINDLDAYRFLTQYLRDKKVRFRGLCYAEKAKVNIAGSFGAKEVNFWGFPKSEAVDQFLGTEYDLLINVSVTQNFPMEVLTALTKAHFKIGWQQGPLELYDLNVDVSKNPDSLYLAKQEIYYIEQFNKKT